MDIHGTHPLNEASRRRTLARTLLGARERIQRLARLAPTITSEREALRSLAEGYELSAKRRRARGDEIGAQGDEACANAIAIHLADLEG